MKDIEYCLGYQNFAAIIVIKYKDEDGTIVTRSLTVEEINEICKKLNSQSEQSNK